MLDQSLFRLLSGSDALECLEIGDFETVRDTLQLRLLRSLCMTESPEDDDENILLWNQLLADALAVSVDVKQNQGIASENMRNYSYQLRDYAYTWEMLSHKSNDLLDLFNVCPSGVTMQRDVAARIYGRDCDRCEGYCECL